MVNLVIVSHSRELSEGVMDVARQMAGGQIRVAAVGGIANDDGTYRLGTDPKQISEAVRQVWNADGVLILIDLGSAVLSAEMALDLLPPEMRQRCLVSNAPLVEGAVVAALEASIHHSLEAVNEAAEAVCQFAKVVR